MFCCIQQNTPGPITFESWFYSEYSSIKEFGKTLEYSGSENKILECEFLNEINSKHE